MARKIPKYLAVHEAGHAVAACILYRVVGVSGWHPFSRVFVRPRTDWQTPHVTRRGAAIPCGGMLDEPDFYKPMFRKVRNAGLAPDLLATMRARMEAGAIVSIAGPFAEARYRRQSQAAAILAGGDGDWKFIKMTTGEFCRTKAEQSALIADLERRTSALLRVPANWQAVLNVADALLAKRSLTSKQVYRIMGNAR